MCEESACLVPPLKQVPRGSSESRRMSVSPDSTCFISNRDDLIGFHEDALSQAAMGKAQIVLAIVLGLSLAADCSEVAMLNFILPAAELQLCIEEHKKGWLVAITLLAMAAGSVTWGVLGDYVGRRRALILALTVAALFSAVASVMPTYGIFMTARFCSGFGVAGAFPLSFSYLTETCSRTTRSRYGGILHSMWPVGAVYTAILFHITMPTLGEDIVKDNREHWSSWHRFLLLSILPTVGCIIGLIWASESPRYLLEASREVEALAVYQRLHKLNKTRTQYGLSELELPGRSAYRDRPVSPTTTRFAEGLGSFREAILKIISPMHLRTTFLLASLHMLVGFIYMGMSTFSVSLIKELREKEYLSEKTFVENRRFTGQFNETIENVFYKDCVFDNATFTHMNLIHVNFWNCTFSGSEFINVKTSVLSFESSNITNSRFIDTDLTDHHFIHCSLINTTFFSIISNCVVEFDYNIYLDDLFEETLGWAVAMIPSLLIIGFIGEYSPRPRLTVILWLLISQAGGGILLYHLFGYSITVFMAVGAVLKIMLMCVLNVITLIVLEAYPCHLRCTAHGMLRSLFHLASLCAIPIYNMLVHTSLIFPATITISLSFSAALLSFKVQDNSKVLL